ncbi:hypothetical protein OG458_41960 (plasmid) [Streptomyces sp. NBC_01281]|uniref:hypothetical protein n=1 Tax=Streptomyces sp. NBC_01281 TaxID=2903811 RepID=UPI002E0F842F|nr:hypothetical protein OG458_41960 [Streptomyces sp. NBC_01281]
MHSHTPGLDGAKENRREAVPARVRITLRLMLRRFLLGLAYGAGVACVSLAVPLLPHLG